MDGETRRLARAAGRGCVVRGNVAHDNGSHGIVARDRVILDDATRGNGQVGILVQGESTVIGNDLPLSARIRDGAVPTRVPCRACVPCDSTRSRSASSRARCASPVT